MQGNGKSWRALQTAWIEQIKLEEKALIARELRVCVITQSCLTLSDPMDGSPPGFSAHGILQARILEWVAISFSKRAT